MRALISVVLAAVLAAPASLAAQQAVSSDVEMAALRETAAAIPLGSRVKLRTHSGRRLTATLMAVDADRIVVKRDARVPEPAVAIAFTDLAELRRDEKTGFTIAKALGVGLAAGVGAMLTLFTIMVTVGD